MRCLILLVVLTWGSVGNATESCRDQYVGSVQTEWLDDGRTMKLLAPFSYCDPAGQKWDAPAGSVVDGASIPQFAWSIIGGPFEGPYRNASVIHDVACVEKSKPWRTVHDVFYYAMIKSGVSLMTAKIMYAAVYHYGPRWGERVIVRNLPPGAAPTARFEARRMNPGEGEFKIEAEQPKIQGTQLRSDFVLYREAPPPPPRSEFERLKASIEQKERANPGSVSLEQIRSLSVPQ